MHGTSSSYYYEGWEECQVAVLVVLLVLSFLAWYWQAGSKLRSQVFVNRKSSSWPIRQDPLGGPGLRLVMLLVDQWNIHSLGASSYAVFSDFRTGLFGRHYLCGDNVDVQVQPGPAIDRSSTDSELTPDGLQKHLQKFTTSNSCQSKDKWFYIPQTQGVTLRKILFHNEAAWNERLQIIRQATCSIWIATWALEDSQSAISLANLLIQKHNQGVDVRVLVDGVYFEYLLHREALMGVHNNKGCYTQTMRSLADNGVSVRRIETWFHTGNNVDEIENDKSAYVVGSHRKLMLVDNRILLTGGRNVSDEYYTSHQFHFLDCEVVLEAQGETFSFEDTTGSLLQGLWEKATPVHGSSQPSQSDTDNPPMPSTHGQEETNWSEHPVSLFQLDHCAGNPKGHDIIFSTLLYLIETAHQRIDLICGYFQLFPALDDALTRAVARGVHIRLVTNSDETTDLAMFHKVTRQALERLLVLGVEIQMGVPAKTPQSEYCIHHKIVVVDEKAVMMGSWNCLGTSVFHDDEFSVVMFAPDSGVSSIFDTHVAGLAQEGCLEAVTSLSKGAFQLPKLYSIFASNYGRTQMNRGF